jgi:hypothetical protein
MDKEAKGGHQFGVALSHAYDTQSLQVISRQTFGSGVFSRHSTLPTTASIDGRVLWTASSSEPSIDRLDWLFRLLLFSDIISSSSI